MGRWLKLSDTEMISQRLISRSVWNDGCLEWQGCRVSDGYGMIKIERKSWSTHRLMWFIHHGDIPLDQHVLHECDNPPCINIDHLFLGTQLENRWDAIYKKRVAVGEENGRSKLTEDQVRKIYNLSHSGHSHPIVAAIFNVGTTTVSQISLGRTWRHLNLKGE